MNVFTNDAVRARLDELRKKIHELELEADKLAEEEYETTKFLSDEQREELDDLFTEQAGEAGSPDDLADQYMETSYYSIGQKNFTDFDLLKEFVSVFPPEDPYDRHELWKKTLSHNLAAVAAVAKIMEERDAKT